MWVLPFSDELLRESLPKKDFTIYPPCWSQQDSFFENSGNLCIQGKATFSSDLSDFSELQGKGKSCFRGILSGCKHPKSLIQ
jgi:hypothetical protein